MIDKINLFQNLDRAVIQDIILCLNRKVYVPGQYVVRKDEIGEEMYIISYGRVTVVLPQVKISLGTGDYIGEQALLTSGKRNADVICASHCELLVWKKPVFIKLCKKYPELPMHILQRSAQYRTSDGSQKEHMEVIVRRSVVSSNHQEGDFPPIN